MTSNNTSEQEGGFEPERDLVIIQMDHARDGRRSELSFTYQSSQWEKQYLYGQIAEDIYGMLRDGITRSPVVETTLSQPNTSKEEFSLLTVLADIRHKTGLGDKPMLSELADEIVNLIEEAHKDGEWCGRNGY